MTPITLDTWLARFRAAHGDRYDYRDVAAFRGGKTTIAIHCPAHGVFQQSAQKHAAGQGCPTCGLLARSASQIFDTPRWVATARATHGDRYDYAKVVYCNDRERVTITCTAHGDFKQIAGTHTQGRGCPKCGNEAKGLGRQKDVSHFVRRAHAAHEGFYDYSRVEYTSAQAKVEIICPKHGAFWQGAADHAGGNGCPRCVWGAPSKREDELFALVHSIRPDAEQSNRKLLAPKELDIIVPGLKLAIEFNGVYWHSDRRTAIDAAAFKHAACAALGWRLITIACEDWKTRRPQFERLVRHALGASELPRVHARECAVRTVPNGDAVAFLDAHHPQQPGAIYAQRFGLYHPVLGLVALMTFGQDVYRVNRGDAPVWDLTRFATSAQVRGGASKLFAAARRALGFTEVISYSANDWFGGDLYARLGFVQAAKVPPDYRVYHHAIGLNSRRGWSRQFLPARLAQIGRAEVVFDPATDPRTEWEVEDTVNAFRVWDSGKVKWRWTE